MEKRNNIKGMLNLYGYVPQYAGGICSALPNHTGVFGTASLPYRTIPGCSVRPQYRYRHFGKFGTSVSSVRLQYRYPIRYPTLRYVRYKINPGTRPFSVKVYRGYSGAIPRGSTLRYRYPVLRSFGMTSLPVPDTSVRSVQL